MEKQCDVSKAGVGTKRSQNGKSQVGTVQFSETRNEILSCFQGGLRVVLQRCDAASLLVNATPSTSREPATTKTIEEQEQWEHMSRGLIVYLSFTKQQQLHAAHTLAGDLRSSKEERVGGVTGGVGRQADEQNAGKDTDRNSKVQAHRERATAESATEHFIKNHQLVSGMTDEEVGDVKEQEHNTKQKSESNAGSSLNDHKQSQSQLIVRKGSLTSEKEVKGSYGKEKKQKETKRQQKGKLQAAPVSAAEKLLKEAVVTILNAPLLTTGQWGDGEKTFSICQHIANFHSNTSKRGYKHNNEGSESTPKNTVEAACAQEISIMVIPQAGLTSKFKNKGKSLQYHDQVDKTTGRILYEAFLNSLHEEVALLSNRERTARGSVVKPSTKSVAETVHTAESDDKSEVGKKEKVVRIIAGTFGARQGLRITSECGPFTHTFSL